MSDQPSPDMAAVEAVLAAGEEVPPPDRVAEILGPGCPVRPLGYRHEHYWFIDALGRCVSRSPRDFAPGQLLSLFAGDLDWLAKQWPPQARSSGQIDSVTAAGALMRACAEAGPFEPSRVRGPGVWPRGDDPGPAAGLVVNLGDALAVIPPGAGWAAREWRSPGSEIDGHIYAAGEASFHPADTLDEARAAEAVDAVLAVLNRLPWTRPEIGPRVMLGALALGYLCGAAPFRTIVALEGDFGSGKSQPLKLFDRLLGQNGDRYENVTYDRLRVDLQERNGACCFLLDEFEAQARPRGGGKSKAEEVVDLFRYTFTWGQGRGGRGGGANYDFTAHASAVLAATQIPRLGAADVSRIVLLRIDKRLMPTEAGAVADFEAAMRRAARYGPELFRLAIDRFAGWERVFRAYRAALIAQNAELRGADTYASNLAFAHLLDEPAEMDDATLAAKAAGWAPQFRYEEMRAGLDAASAAERCWLHLLSSVVRTTWSGGTNPTIRRLIDEARERAARTELERKAALEVLSELGIAFVRPRKDDPERGIRAGAVYIAVANSMAGVVGLFDGTPWAGGGHARVLADLADPDSGRKAFIHKNPINALPERARGVCVPLDLVARMDVFDDSFADEPEDPQEDDDDTIPL